MEVKVFLLRTCVNIVGVAQPPSRGGVGAGVLPLQGVGCPVPRYECRNKHPHAGRGAGNGPGVVPGEAPHRHQELRARALPGLKQQQADIQRGVLAQTAAGRSREEGAEVSGIKDEIRDEF